MSSIKFQKGSIKIGKKHATIQIPLGIAQQLYGAGSKPEGSHEMFFGVIGKTLHASPLVPDISIPSMHLEKQYFIPQKV